MREAQTMRQLNHPNLLPLLTSFVHEQNLWMVMPYVQGGSVLNVMRFAYPEVQPRGRGGPLARPCRPATLAGGAHLLPCQLHRTRYTQPRGPSSNLPPAIHPRRAWRSR